MTEYYNMVLYGVTQKRNINLNLLKIKGLSKSGFIIVNL